MKAIFFFLLGAVFCGCKSPVGPTAPSSFQVVPHNQIVQGEEFYEHSETGRRIDRAKSLVWYGQSRLALEATYINGRLHSARSYMPDGSLASEIKIGTGSLRRFHPDGTPWETRTYSRGVYLTFKEYRGGTLYREQTINWGSPLPNDGLAAFFEQVSQCFQAVFNEKNGKLVVGLVVTAAVGYGVSMLLQSLASESEVPPPGHYRNSDGVVEHMNPSMSNTVTPAPAPTPVQQPPIPTPPPGWFYDSSLGEIMPIHPLGPLN